MELVKAIVNMEYRNGSYGLTPVNKIPANERLRLAQLGGKRLAQFNIIGSSSQLFLCIRQPRAVE